MEKTTTKEKKPKKVEEQVEYFTDEHHKTIFPFQEGYKSGTGSGNKTYMKPVSFSRTRR
jgi:hypothetical protein